jgi:hypothetical protein
MLYDRWYSIGDRWYMIHYMIHCMIHYMMHYMIYIYDVYINIYIYIIFIYTYVYLQVTHLGRHCLENSHQFNAQITIWDCSTAQRLAQTDHCRLQGLQNSQRKSRLIMSSWNATQYERQPTAAPKNTHWDLISIFQAGHSGFRADRPSADCARDGKLLVITLRLLGLSFQDLWQIKSKQSVLQR